MQLSDPTPRVEPAARPRAASGDDLVRATARVLRPGPIVDGRLAEMRAYLQLLKRLFMQDDARRGS